MSRILFFVLFLGIRYPLCGDQDVSVTFYFDDTYSQAVFEITNLREESIVIEMLGGRYPDVSMEVWYDDIGFLYRHSAHIRIDFGYGQPGDIGFEVESKIIAPGQTFNYGLSFSFYSSDPEVDRFYNSWVDKEESRQVMCFMLVKYHVSGDPSVRKVARSKGVSHRMLRREIIQMNGTKVMPRKPILNLNRRSK